MLLCGQCEGTAVGRYPLTILYSGSGNLVALSKKNQGNNKHHATCKIFANLVSQTNKYKEICLTYRVY